MGLLDIGASFDWISPVLAGLQDIANGPSYTFLVPSGSGRSGKEIDGLLHQYGVKTWGLMVVNDTLMITVKEQQARWADHILQTADIPLLNPIATNDNSEGVTWGWDE